MTDPSPDGHVPEKPLFTGREDLQAMLERCFNSADERISWAQAIPGLGEIGNTQIAIEDGHRHRER